MRSYDPGYRELKSLLDARKFGRPLLFHCAHWNPAGGESFNTPMGVTSAGRRGTVWADESGYGAVSPWRPDILHARTDLAPERAWLSPT